MKIKFENTNTVALVGSLPACRMLAAAAKLAVRRASTATRSTSYKGESVDVLKDVC